MFANTVWEYPDEYNRPAQTNLDVHSLSRVMPFNCTLLTAVDNLHYFSLSIYTENNGVVGQEQLVVKSSKCSLLDNHDKPQTRNSLWQL